VGNPPAISGASSAPQWNPADFDQFADERDLADFDQFADERDPAGFYPPRRRVRMVTLDACRREIEALHAFFVGWYAGERNDFDRMERALGPGFEMITPGGERLDREEVLAAVRGAHGEHAAGAFDIEIRSVEPVDVREGVAAVRYEEWQTNSGPDAGSAGGGGTDAAAADRATTGRISTALFHADPDAPEGVAWAALHETWLEPPGD